MDSGIFKKQMLTVLEKQSIVSDGKHLPVFAFIESSAKYFTEAATKRVHIADGKKLVYRYCQIPGKTVCKTVYFHSIWCFFLYFYY